MSIRYDSSQSYSSNNRTTSSDVQTISEVGTTEPVTLEEAKNWIRRTNTVLVEDSIIEALITTCRQQAEAYINADITPKQRKVFYNFLEEPVNLYFAPISSIDEVVVDGTTLVEDAGYEVDGLTNPLINLLDTRSEKVEITYTTAGMLTRPEVKLGILALIDWRYNDRSIEEVTKWQSIFGPIKTYGYYGVR